jgi:hypothetical protein
MSGEKSASVGSASEMQRKTFAECKTESVKAVGSW